jgi:hypothetical protein
MRATIVKIDGTVKSRISRLDVIPGLTRNPAVFQGVKTMDAGSGSGMTGRKRVLFVITIPSRKPEFFDISKLEISDQVRNDV